MSVPKSTTSAIPTRRSLGEGFPIWILRDGTLVHAHAHGGNGTGNGGTGLVTQQREREVHGEECRSGTPTCMVSLRSAQSTHLITWLLRAVQCIAGMSTLSALESYLAAACVHCIAAMSNPSTLASTWPLPKPEVSSLNPHGRTPSSFPIQIGCSSSM